MPKGKTVKNAHDLRLVAKDNGSNTTEWSIYVPEGELAALHQKLRTKEVYQTRGKITAIRSTDREVPTFTLQIQLTNFSGEVDRCGDSELNPGDVFGFRGGASGWASTLPVCKGGSDVKTVDLEFIMAGTDLGDPTDHKMTLQHVYGVATPVLGSPNTWSIECSLYGGITGDITLAEA